MTRPDSPIQPQTQKAPRCPRKRFEEQCRLTPDAPALRTSAGELSFEALNQDANRLAHYYADRGVESESLVVLLLEPSPDLVIAALACLKSRAAYLYLDPNQPAAWLDTMIADADPDLILSTADTSHGLGLIDREVLNLDGERADIARFSSADPTEWAEWTGLTAARYGFDDESAEGELVELHQLTSELDKFGEDLDSNVSTWLVPESTDELLLGLLWPLTYGSTLAFEADREQVTTAVPNAAMDFSLYFFASHEGAKDAPDKYQLILDAARYADDHGFDAVWSPERHFHAFGGLSPNPSVMSAALAMHTKRVQLRSGSVVTPLHHPIRIAEEWSLVDNLSGGRVGLGVASGWFPNDFVMAKENFEARKEIMFENIETLRKLWRGESIPCENPLGDTVDIHVVPNPIQKELPIWVTAAVNPDTFRRAGALGANVLTHLLGQSLEQLEHNIKVYREAWHEAGHPGRGCISLMLHTFVGDSDREVLDRVRDPMKRYLGSSVNLVANYIKSLPIYKENIDVDVSHLSADEVDAILEHSFQRYFHTCGLFGTVETCVEQVDRFKQLGVDDLACLVDFGLDSETVLAALDRLDEVRKASNRKRKPNSAFAHAVQELGVRKVQLTTAFARRLLADENSAGLLEALETVIIDDAKPNDPDDSTTLRQLREHTTARLVVRGSAIDARSEAGGESESRADSNLESTIGRIWSELLGVDEIRADDNFFDLGGHSLLTIRVQSRLQDDLGLELPLTTLFRYPTIRTLVAHLQHEGSEDPNAETVNAGSQRAQRRRKAQRRRRR